MDTMVIVLVLQQSLDYLLEMDYNRLSHWITNIAIFSRDAWKGELVYFRYGTKKTTYQP